MRDRGQEAAQGREPLGVDELLLEALLGRPVGDDRDRARGAGQVTVSDESATFATSAVVVAVEGSNTNTFSLPLPDEASSAVCSSWIDSAPAAPPAPNVAASTWSARTSVGAAPVSESTRTTPSSSTAKARSRRPGASGSTRSESEAWGRKSANAPRLSDAVTAVVAVLSAPTAPPGFGAAGVLILERLLEPPPPPQPTAVMAGARSRSRAVAHEDRTERCMAFQSGPRVG